MLREIEKYTIHYETQYRYTNKIRTNNMKTLYELSQEAFEKEWLVKILHQTRHNQSKAAKLMGVSRGTLRKKLRHHFGDEYFKDGE